MVKLIRESQEEFDCCKCLHIHRGGHSLGDEHKPFDDIPMFEPGEMSPGTEKDRRFVKPKPEED